MITCLDNLVGVDKRCSPQESLSGLYLNDLSSFSLKLASAGMGSEATGPVQFAEKMLSLAQDEIRMRFRQHLQPYMKLTSVLENQTAGQYPENRETLAVTKQGGWKVAVRTGDYLKFDLHSITLFWNTTATVAVRVYNLLTGNLLDTFSVSMVANVPTELVVSKSYSGDNIQLGIFTSGSGQPFKVNYNGCTTCPHKTTYVSLTPSETDIGIAPTVAGVDSLGHSYGMMLKYSVSCDAEPFICNLSPSLPWALREGAAAQLFTAIMGSMERWNTYVTVNADKAKFWYEYHQGRFDLMMTDILRNMAIPECVCYSCNSFVKKVTQVP